MAEREFDIAIIGGGPAGLSAAIWSARYLHSVCVIDSGDPRNWETRGINGYLGLDDIRPSVLRGKGRETCRALGVDLIDPAVLRVEQRHDEDLLTCLEGGDRVIAACAVAIGIRDVWPEIGHQARTACTRLSGAAATMRATRKCRHRNGGRRAVGRRSISRRGRARSSLHQRSRRSSTTPVLHEARRAEHPRAHRSDHARDDGFEAHPLHCVRERHAARRQ